MSERAVSVRAALWGAAAAAPLAYGLGRLFLHLTRAHESAATGPTAATLDEVFNSLFGAGLGIAVGGAVSAIVVRRWLPFVAVGVAVISSMAVDTLLFFQGALAGRDDLILGVMLVVPAIAFALLGYVLALGSLHIWRHVWRREAES